jgi:hypothetical protein
MGDASGNVSLRRMLGLGWFRLGCGEDGASLVEMAAFVGGNDVDAGGEAEADSFNEWINEGDGGEIEVGIGAKEILGFRVGGEEGGGSVGERGSGARLNGLRRFGFDFGGRLEQADEPGAEKAGERGAAAKFVGAASGVGSGLHGADVDAIGGGEMIEAFGNAPRGGMGTPGGLGFGETGEEGLRVGVGRGVGVVQSFDLGVHFRFGKPFNYRRGNFGPGEGDAL